MLFGGIVKDLKIHLHREAVMTTKPNHLHTLLSRGVKRGIRTSSPPSAVPRKSLQTSNNPHTEKGKDNRINKHLDTSINVSISDV